MHFEEMARLITEIQGIAKNGSGSLHFLFHERRFTDVRKNLTSFFWHISTIPATTKTAHDVVAAVKADSI